MFANKEYRRYIIMNKFTQIIKSFAITAVMAGVFVGLGGHASARTLYSGNGNATSKTPVFNEFYGVPNGVGDEADFVRVKPQAGGNDAYVNNLNTTCNTGDEYTVRTYIHNGASPDYNDNGAGSAVAHNVVVAMTAPLDQTNSNFTFSSKVTSSNSASVSDSASLGCGSDFKLSLVPQSVQTYSKTLGFNTELDSSVNGTLKIGSRAHGSGDQWACWDDRIIVVYTVKVIKKPVVVDSLGECKLIDVKVFDNRKVRVSITGKTTNATILGYTTDFGDGTKSDNQTSEHTYAKDGTYKIVSKVQIKLANGDVKWVDSVACTSEVTFKPGQPPVVVPPVAPPTPTPTSLPSTGPGDIISIFAATSIAGAMIHKFVLSRRYK